MKTQREKIKAVASIRNLVIGIDSSWKELKTLGKEIDEELIRVNDLFIGNTTVAIHSKWLAEYKIIQQKVSILRSIMNETIKQINAKDASSLTKTWNQYEEHANQIFLSLQAMSEMGKVYLTKPLEISTWTKNWDKIFSKLHALQEIAKGSSLQLAMIEEFSPSEVEELTDTILKHMPRKYSIEEALQYESEYMDAYESLKTQATKKKNLWDRFLDLLAGGQQQSPAEMVMMQRWINGEKGDVQS